MPAIFDFLYREYCRARLAEMPKQPLLIADAAVPEANCDVRDSNGSDGGLDDDITAARHQALRSH